MERSVIRGSDAGETIPDFASLHPGYKCQSAPAIDLRPRSQTLLDERIEISARKQITLDARVARGLDIAVLVADEEAAL